MAPMFPSGILSTLCLLSLRQDFFSAFQTFCDMLKSENGNACYFPSFFILSFEKKKRKDSLYQGLNKSHQLNWIEFVHLYVLHS